MEDEAKLNNPTDHTEERTELHMSLALIWSRENKLVVSIGFVSPNLGPSVERPSWQFTFSRYQGAMQGSF